MTTRTFVFGDEDHTLGNCLRFCLQQNADVVLAGYDVPHPAEEQIQLRVQVVEGADPVSVVVKAAQLMDKIADDYLLQLYAYM